MGIHDWTRVASGTVHDFHSGWILHLKEALNEGILPPDYYAMAVYRGIILEVYQIHGWHPAGTTLYTIRTDVTQETARWEFVGERAKDFIRDKYYLKSVNHLFPQGSQTPFRYVNCEGDGQSSDEGND